MQALIDREAAPDRGPQTAARILVIESDPARSSRLTRILRAHVRADLEIVKSTSDALRSMIEHVPDLVLTSTFLPPAEESSLNAHLRQTPGAAHVQVITVPHFIDDDDDTPSGASARKVISFLTRRASLDAPACDPTTVIQDINAYLEHSRARRLAASADRQAATGLIAAPVKSLLTSDGALRQPFGPADAAAGNCHGSGRSSCPGVRKSRSSTSRTAACWSSLHPSSRRAARWTCSWSVRARTCTCRRGCCAARLPA
jgi:DNA-binding NarL/FixJ family response regulator